MAAMRNRPGSRRPAARLLLPAGMLVFCAIAFWLTMQFDRVPPILKRGIEPSDFPQLVIGLIGLLCIADIFTDRSAPPGKLPAVVWQTLMAMAGFAALAQADLFLGLGLFAAALGFLWGERRVPVFIALGAGLPLAVFFFFEVVFEIRFPRGLLTNLWYGWA